MAAPLAGASRVIQSSCTWQDEVVGPGETVFQDLPSLVLCLKRLEGAGQEMAKFRDI